MQRLDLFQSPHVCLLWLLAKLLSQSNAELNGADEAGGL